MHLAILSPIAWRTPPTHYGPWERVVSLLVEGLVQRGIDVTLFATADSETNAKLHAIVPRPYEEDKGLDPKVWECLHISELFERAEEFDLIHNHYDFLPLTYAGLISTPVLTTIHGFSSPKILPVYKKFNERTYYVSISNADRSPELDYVATVYHGIDLENFSFNPKPNETLLFFGRIHPDKGTLKAIDIARLAGKKLIIAGIVQDRHYFETEVEPHIDGVHVRYVGSADPHVRDKLLGEASALLHPIDFNEPFGLSVVEANACGTPVVAFKRGSMPELVIDGVNGFLVSDVAGAVEAIRRIGTLSRKACRENAERRFSRDRMVDEYLKVYSEILSKAQREDHRPWGYYEVLSDREDHKVKRIVVFPGKRLSLQQHSHRSEHWMIVKGEAVVTRGSEAIELKAGQAIDIPKGTRHRVLNVREEPLIFIEIQTGEAFGENDIERLEDDFGRV